MSRTCSISTMIHHEFHPKRESTIFHHMFTYPSKILRCSTQKSRDGPRTSPDFSAFSRFPSMEAATQLSALLRTTEALARYGAQRRVAVALQCRMRQKWQRKKYLVTWQLGEVMWGYVFIILEDYILNFHSLFMSHTLLDSSLFIFIHLYSSLLIFIHLYSPLFINESGFKPIFATENPSFCAGDVCRILRSSGVSCCSCNAGGVLCRSAAASGGFSAWGEPMEVLMMGKSAITLW